MSAPCERALAQLAQNPLHHMGMMYPIRRGTARILAADARGVLLQEMKSGAYMLSAKNREAAKDLFGLVDTMSLACMHQDFAAAECAQKFGLSVTLRCHQAVWPREKAPAVPSSPYCVQTLTADRLDAVAATYSHDIGRAYLAGRIADGEMLGAFCGGELAGFIGMHEEGSMGMLEVSPSFQRRGVATLLLSKLIERVLAQGLVPFSQFLENNEPSRKLHAHLGFLISEESIHWLEAST